MPNSEYKLQQEKHRQQNNIPKFKEIIEDLNTVNELVSSILIDANTIKKMSEMTDSEIGSNVSTDLSKNIIRPLQNIGQNDIPNMINNLNKHINSVTKENYNGC